MTSTTRYRRTGLPLLAAVFVLALVFPAAAQTWPADIERDTAPAEQAAAPAEAASPDAAAPEAAASDATGSDAAPADVATADPGDADIMKDVDVSKLDWSQLNGDEAALGGPAPKDRARKDSAHASAKWSNNAQPNGVSNVSVKKSVTPFWDTRIGADMTVARQGTLTTSEILSEKLANGGSLPESSATAWAAISAPGVSSIWDKTTVEARVDPAQDQSKVGTTLSKSLPLSDQYSLTLQGGYNLIQQGIVPVPGIIGHPSRSYQTDQSAKLSIADTGTSLMAAQTLSTADDRWLRRVGAEQKLFGGVTITGSLGETTTGDIDKSLRARFTRSW